MFGFAHSPFSSAYLPSGERGDQENLFSGRGTCIAHRGVFCLRVSFGVLGRAIFALTQSIFSLMLSSFDGTLKKRTSKYLVHVSLSIAVMSSVAVLMPEVSKGHYAVLFCTVSRCCTFRVTESERRAWHAARNEWARYHHRWCLRYLHMLLSTSGCKPSMRVIKRRLEVLLSSLPVHDWCTIVVRYLEVFSWHHSTRKHLALLLSECPNDHIEVQNKYLHLFWHVLWIIPDTLYLEY